MLDKKGSETSPVPAASLLAAWAQALQAASEELLADDPSPAVRRAKALCAVIGAASEVQDYVRLKMTPTEEDDDPEEIRRAFRTRIDSIRRALDYPPAFGDDPGEGD